MSCFPQLNFALEKTDTVLYLSIHGHFLMKGLLADKGNGIYAQILRRLIFVRHHITLINSLPFKYFYRSNGKRVNPYIRVLTALFTGKFLTDIVATNSPWIKDRHE